MSVTIHFGEELTKWRIFRIYFEKFPLHDAREYTLERCAIEAIEFNERIDATTSDSVIAFIEEVRSRPNFGAPFKIDF